MWTMDHCGLEMQPTDLWSMIKNKMSFVFLSASVFCWTHVLLFPVVKKCKSFYRKRRNAYWIKFIQGNYYLARSAEQTAGEINLISIAKFRILVHLLIRIQGLLKHDITLTFQGQENTPDCINTRLSQLAIWLKLNPYPKTWTWFVEREKA